MKANYSHFKSLSQFRIFKKRFFLLKVHFRALNLLFISKNPIRCNVEAFGSLSSTSKTLKALFSKPNFFYKSVIFRKIYEKIQT